ncbi:ER membrane protein complex subunit 7 [Daldinia childiae]|uniref:ER membrane protein complex subunit 7 n=1 Tax=Daldinia childiae TaxID=326645 RepID=UPI0014456CBE|nr:ER membrane protein complex subunit 7 [Daldinia childiae]KAF3070548.1 ER membrane protein complex subunit 7 [Daldinia childiae]
MQISLSTALLGVLSTFAGSSAASSSKPQSQSQPQTTITLWIPSSQPLPNPHVLPSTTHATLSALRAGYHAPLTAAGSFVFRNVTPGSYLADVHSGTHAFAPLRIDVLAHTPADEGDAGEEEGGRLAVRAWETYRGNDWDNKGQEAPRSGSGFAVRVLGPKEYFVERGSFSILSILKNPMILMGLVSMVLFIGMPKLIENMDPEMRAEWEEQQKSNPMSSLMGGGGGQPGANPMGNFDMAAYLAGQGTKKDDPEPASSSSSKGGKR